MVFESLNLIMVFKCVICCNSEALPHKIGIPDCQILSIQIFFPLLFLTFISTLKGL